MGRRGPLPKRTSLKILGGSERKKPKRRQVLATGRPRCPSYLPDAAKERWKVIMASMPVGFFSACDRDALAMSCWWYAEFLAACEAGEAARTKSASMEMRSWDEKLGLSPSARARLTMPDEGEQKAKDSMTAFIGSKPKAPRDRA